MAGGRLLFHYSGFAICIYRFSQLDTQLETLISFHPHQSGVTSSEVPSSLSLHLSNPAVRCHPSPRCMNQSIQNSIKCNRLNTLINISLPSCNRLVIAPYAKQQRSRPKLPRSTAAMEPRHFPSSLIQAFGPIQASWKCRWPLLHPCWLHIWSLHHRLPAYVVPAPNRWKSPPHSP